MTSPPMHDLEHVEDVLTHAIAAAFESCGEAWVDDTSGDRLARVAAQAVGRQLLESGLKVRHARADLTAQEHRQAAGRLLSEASHRTAPGGRPVARDGRNVDLEVLRLLVARAQVHALLAALPAVD